MKFGQELTPEMAEKLMLGLLTDTGRLKFIKAETLKNLSTLISVGADFDKISGFLNCKSRLMDEIQLAKVFKNAKKIRIGDTFGIMLPVDYETADEMDQKYGIKNIQKKIFKMENIENCSFCCIFAENKPGEFDLEFRSTAICGNFYVKGLACLYGGNGHPCASGCHLSGNDGYDKQKIFDEISNKAIEMFSEQGKNIKEITLSKHDESLAQIFEKTDKLSKGVTPKTLSKLSKLIEKGVNYEYLLKSFKTFEEFMLQNELLSRVQISDSQSKKPNANIFLSPEDVKFLMDKYNVTEEQILNVISIFANIDIESASIVLPNGKKSQINNQGEISLKANTSQNRFR